MKNLCPLESSFKNPFRKVGSRIVKPPVATKLNQHVEGHAQSLCVDTSLVINNSFNNGIGTSFRQGILRLFDEHLLVREIPVM